MTNSIHQTRPPRTQPADRPANQTAVPSTDAARSESSGPEELLRQFKQQAALFNQLEQTGQLRDDQKGQALKDQVNEACTLLEELLAGPLALEETP